MLETASTFFTKTTLIVLYRKMVVIIYYLTCIGSRYCV